MFATKMIGGIMSMVPVVSFCSCFKRVGDTVLDLIPDFGLIKVLKQLLSSFSYNWILRVDSKEMEAESIMYVLLAFCLH